MILLKILIGYVEKYGDMRGERERVSSLLWTWRAHFLCVRESGVCVLLIFVYRLRKIAREKRRE